ncbi:unnamed protein product [Musa hybrid cultivar]
MWCRPFRLLLCPMLRVVVWYLRTSTYPSSHTPLHQALVLRWEEIDSPQEIRAKRSWTLRLGWHTLDATVTGPCACRTT